MSKSELRAHFRALRAQFVDSLNQRERAIAFSRAPAPLVAYFQPGKIVAGYMPVGSEADPRALLAQAKDRGCITALPFVTSQAQPMRFLQWSPGDPLESGPFGLLQPDSHAKPVSPDVLLVPLLAFDSRMMRLGQGAGHYDRALSLLEQAVAVGVAWSLQSIAALPSEPWDVPLDAILTEKAWIAS